MVDSTAVTRAAERPQDSHIRWTVCAMLFAATSINYMDRQVLSILAPTLQHSIGWTEQQYGYIVGAFQLAYALGLIAAGRMVDKLGTRLGYSIVMALWSAAAMAHSLVRSAFGFGVARFFLGLGESGNFPAAVQLRSQPGRHPGAGDDSVDHAALWMASRLSGDGNVQLIVDCLVGVEVSPAAGFGKDIGCGVAVD
jgi:hypothetical protein